MNSETEMDNEQRDEGWLKQITRRQWVIAVIVLIAVPVVVYFANFWLFPYVQDLFEGESPLAATLSEYGVAEDADTQLLTIRRGDLVNSVSVNGTLEYSNREQLSFGTDGTIDAINVEVGDFVSKDDVLMSLEGDAIVDAEKELRNASTALQDAEEKLEELINPGDGAISDATLKIATTRQALSDAEEKLLSLTTPSGVDIADAELKVAKAASDLEVAQEELSNLIEPSGVAVENARLAVAEAEKTLDDLTEELISLTAQDSAAMRDAELAVNEAIKSRQDAVEAYEEAINVDEADVDSARLELEKAKLALVEAETSVVDAERGLEGAESGIEDDISSKELEIAKAMADVASAALALSDAREAVAEAKELFDEEVVADLEEKIGEAEEDIEVAEDQLNRNAIESDAKIRDLEIDLQDARDAYQDVFAKWLGMDISKYSWEKSPDEIFEDVGKTLIEIMSIEEVVEGLGDSRTATSDWVEDDPKTPWSESVVASWSEFFLGQLRFDCTETGTGISDECVNTEFENAWDVLLDKTEAYQTAKLSNSQQLDSHEDALVSAQKNLEELKEQLEKELTPASEEEMNDLLAKESVGYYTYVNAQNNHGALLDELEMIKSDADARIAKAKQALVVAEDTLRVARNDVAVAESKLEELNAGPDEVEVSIALSKANKAEADLMAATQKLFDLRETDSPDITVLNQRINAAEADLEKKRSELDEIFNADDEAVALARAELRAAEEHLDEEMASLEDLVLPDEVDIEVARQEVAVASADLAVAEEGLEDLVSPDPAAVALQRAEVAVAREDLNAARAASTGGAEIIAPFDGVVAEVKVDKGQSVSKDVIAIIIADPSIVEVSGTVDEVDVLFLQVGDSASIELEALSDEPLIGSISEIALFGETSQGQGIVTYPVTIQTEQPSDIQLPEGLSAVAEVVIREQTDQLLVPIQALFGSINQPTLLISNPDGTLEPRQVTLGISDDFWTVVESGVSEGETILMVVVGTDTSLFGGGFGRGVSRSVTVRG